MKIINLGKNNILSIDNSIRSQDLTITMRGDNNLVTIENNISFINGTINIGSNNKLTLKPNSKLGKIEVFSNDFASIIIDEGVNCTFHTRVYSHEPSTIRIGQDCLIASGVIFSTSDMHSIIDLGTGKRVNPAKDIVIGNHVWIAADAKIMGGSSIEDGCVIGAFSIVKSSIPRNCIAAGVPAKVIRSNINWEKELV